MIRTVVRELILWLLTALGGAALCAGLWDCWLSHHISLLIIGSAMLGLVILTRQWMRPERSTGRYAHIPVFVAITLCAPAIGAVAYAGIFILLAVTLGSIASSESTLTLIKTIGGAGAVVIIALFVQREIQRERRSRTPD